MISSKIANNTEKNVKCMFKHRSKKKLFREKKMCEYCAQKINCPVSEGKMDVNFEQKLHTGKSLMRNFGAAATLVLHGFFCADLSIVCVCKIYIRAKMRNSVQNFAEYESKFTHFCAKV